MGVSFLSSMKKILFLSILFFLQYSIAQKSQKLYEKGVEYLETKSYQKAIENFDKSIEINEKFIDAYFDRAIAKTFLKKFEEAILDYSKVIEISPTEEVAFYNRARIYYALKKYNSALSDFESAIKLDSKFVEVYYDLAQTKIKLNDLEGAISTYSNLIVITPIAPSPYYNRALLKYRNGDKGGACEDAMLSKSNNGLEVLGNSLQILINNSCEETKLTKSKEIKEFIDQYNFNTVEQVPTRPGCEKLPKSDWRNCFQSNIQRHIAKNFRYPDYAQKAKIQGRVFIQFIISKDGSISNIKTRGPHPLLEKEANRIISLLPKMSPGSVKGKAVNVPFSIPITFKLQ